MYPFVTFCFYVSPCFLEDSVDFLGGSDDERAIFRKQAARDWECLLLQRAKELKPGSVLQDRQ